jgi:hypothetical protein
MHLWHSLFLVPKHDHYGDYTKSTSQKLRQTFYPSLQGKSTKQINSHLYTWQSHPFIDLVVAIMKAQQTRRSILTFYVPPLSTETNGLRATPSKGNRLMITSYDVMILKRH